MVKGIIEEVKSKYSYKVRIPLYHKIKNSPGCTSSDKLPYATVCTIPGVNPIYQEGDVVWVDFENDELGMPVIKGLLYKESESNALSDINCNSLNVQLESVLPSSTKIGDVEDSIQSIPQMIDALLNLQEYSGELEFNVIDEDLIITKKDPE